VLFHRVDAQSDNFDVAFLKLALKLGHVAEFGGADRREVFGVGEQDSPRLAKPVMELDPALRGFRLEIRGAIANAK
jgi:hypothetical protein